VAKKPQKKSKEKPKTYSTLDQHARKGKTFVPPLALIPNLQHVSWINDRLPEPLWCALLVGHLGQERALDLIRRGIVLSRPLLSGFAGPLDLGLSGIAAMPKDASKNLLEPITYDPDARRVLRSLLLFPSLPGRGIWEAFLEQPSDDDWNVLAFAVAKVLDHQSQEATDCRWARVAFKAVNGRIVLPQSMRELGREVLEYPNYGDQRRVRPTVRSLEMSFSDGPDVPKTAWPDEFWDHCWRSTVCKPASIVEAAPTVGPGTTVERLRQVMEALKAHQRATATGTRLDARHDTVIGSAAYAVAILSELLKLGVPSSILGRTGLRAITEVYITLAYLLSKDDPKLWVAFRSYGAGQAKLAFLKLDAEEALKSGYVSVELLDMIAGEDQSLDLLPIDAGHWGDSNLRTMSEEAEEKAVYDQFYTWTSAFVHGNWAALRATAFDVCLNPLHRAHRVLRSSPALLADVIGDACALVDQVLAWVDAAYPTFAERLTT
jgi:hypothetical protein